MLLLLMHALDETITQALFPSYASTLNPYFFLRNLFGLMVVAGVLLALYRRLTCRGMRTTTGSADYVALIILAVIIGSGFLLDSVQIFSEPVFDRMVVDYLGSDDPEEIEPLKAYWADQFGVAFADLEGTPDRDLFDQGREIHEGSCASCHSRPVWAFVSYPLSAALPRCPMSGP